MFKQFKPFSSIDFSQNSSLLILILLGCLGGEHSILDAAYVKNQESAVGSVKVTQDDDVFYINLICSIFWHVQGFPISDLASSTTGKLSTTRVSYRQIAQIQRSSNNLTYAGTKNGLGN